MIHAWTGDAGRRDVIATAVQQAGTDVGFVLVLLALFGIVPILFGLFRRGAAATRRQSLRRRGPGSGGLSLAARYPGFPFDELGWPRVTDVVTDVVRGRPVTTFDFSYLDDASPANSAVKRPAFRHRFASSDRDTLLLQDAEIVSWHSSGAVADAPAVGAWLATMIDELPPVVWERAASG